MAWVVDSNILLDILLDDPTFRLGSMELLRRRRKRGLVACPLTVVELGPSFDGVPFAIHEFVAALRVAPNQSWTERDTASGCAAWSRYVAQRRARQIIRRPIADVLIGSFAERFDGLLTRNVADFRAVFPSLQIESP